MTKSLLVLVLLAACGRTGTPVTAGPRAGPVPLAELPFVHAVGESMAWEVYWQAMLVGRAELTVGSREERGTFKTNTLARVIAPMQYEVRTSFDDPPRQAPGGGRLHTMTSALAIVRTWASQHADAGYLWLVHDDELYRLDVPRPVRDEALGRPALRIDARARSFDRSTEMDVSIWLGLDRSHTPLRFVVQAGENRVAAELVESTTL